MTAADLPRSARPGTRPVRARGVLGVPVAMVTDMDISDTPAGAAEPDAGTAAPARHADLVLEGGGERGGDHAVLCILWKMG